MKKIFFCVSLALTGLMTSCVDKYQEVDADEKPSWLGSSIYAELENPGSSGLTGTFSTYLRLINELGESETLSRTGSKTVFPANDEAFARFFSNNDWGVSSYEQLSVGQKKLLLYSSMLDNPLLLQLLPNVSNGTAEPQTGGALKHSTNVSVIDTVQHISGKEGMPANNPYWEPFYETGVDIVSDATRPMMIHLTREYMLNNGITTNGDESDFAILTGTPYPEGSQTAFIFNDQVIVPDVTCQNGYIHQMQDVVVPPGNMAQLLRRKENTSYFSRVLDYFAVPVLVQKTTDNYNEWARKQTPQLPDKTIYAMRYLSSRSYNSETDVIGQLAYFNGKNVSNLLNFDPSWNQYYPKPGNESGGIDYSIMDMGAFFVPSNQAMVDYFTQKSPTEKGPGAYLIDIYGNYKAEQNTEAHLLENLDSLHSQKPQVLTAFVNNLMKASFAASVPSKFETVLNDASEHMGLKLELVEKKADGKYDISFANNGAVYVMNELIAPDEYNAVLAPSSTYPDMRVMNWAVQDRGTSSDAPYHLDADYKYYLLSMSSNYAFFIPDDAAFDAYYLDPATLGHRENNQIAGRILPDVLHFYYDATSQQQPPLKCERYYFNLETGTIEGEPRSEEIKNVRTQLVDILNYHTVVLPSVKQDDKFVPVGYNGNHYYKTKHGGEIYVDGNIINGEVKSGPQINNSTIFPAPKITQIYEEKNGHAYRINHVIQPPVESVYAVLSSEPAFSDFLSVCQGFQNRELLDWAGISTVAPTAKKTVNNVETEVEIGPSQYETYQIFLSDYRTGGDVTKDACLDYNVRFFNTYNYTLFAPDNTAMQKAYNEMGLPRWQTLRDIYNKYKDMDEETINEEEMRADSAAVRSMIEAISDFVRYHFVTGSVYADQVIDGGRYKTMASDEMGVAKEVRISGGGGQLNVTDLHSGTIGVNEGDRNTKVVNRMTRDYWFDAAKEHAGKITTSSFCAVHQISEPLCGNKTGKYYTRRTAKSRKR